MLLNKARPTFNTQDPTARNCSETIPRLREHRSACDEPITTPAPAPQTPSLPPPRRAPEAPRPRRPRRAPPPRAAAAPARRRARRRSWRPGAGPPQGSPPAPGPAVPAGLRPPGGCTTRDLRCGCKGIRGAFGRVEQASSVMIQHDHQLWLPGTQGHMSTSEQAYRCHYPAHLDAHVQLVDRPQRCHVERPVARVRRRQRRHRRRRRVAARAGALGQDGACGAQKEMAAVHKWLPCELWGDRHARSRVARARVTWGQGRSWRRRHTHPGAALWPAAAPHLPAKGRAGGQAVSALIE